MTGEVLELYERLRVKLLEKYERVREEYSDPTAPAPLDLKEIIESGEKPIILYFTADWCGPCIGFLETLRKVARKYAGRALFYRVNVDRDVKLADEFRVEYIPATLILVKGSVVYKAYGVTDRESLEEKVERFLGMPG